MFIGGYLESQFFILFRLIFLFFLFPLVSNSVDVSYGILTQGVLLEYPSVFLTDPLSDSHLLTCLHSYIPIPLSLLQPACVPPAYLPAYTCDRRNFDV